MKYQVRANIYFSDENAARSFLYQCQVALRKSTDISPGKPAMELTTIDLIENHHDDDPAAPCKVIEHLQHASITVFASGQGDLLTP